MRRSLARANASQAVATNIKPPHHQPKFVLAPHFTGVRHLLRTIQSCETFCYYCNHCFATSDYLQTPSQALSCAEISALPQANLRNELPSELPYSSALLPPDQSLSLDSPYTQRTTLHRPWPSLSATRRPQVQLPLRRLPLRSSVTRPQPHRAVSLLAMHRKTMPQVEVKQAVEACLAT